MEVPFFVFELAFCKAYVYVFSMDYRFILVGLCFAGSLFSAQFPSAEDFKNPPNNCRFLPIKHGSTVAKPKEAKFQKFSVAESWCNYVNDFGFGGIVTNADWLGENEKGVEKWVNYSYLKKPESFEKLRNLVDALLDKNLRVWIYDEYIYPSGSAGGQVIASNPEFAAKKIQCRKFLPHNGKIDYKKIENFKPFHSVLIPVNNGIADAEQAKVVDDLNVPISVPNGNWQLHVYEVGFSDTWNAKDVWRRSANIMDKNAVAKFIEITHEKYKSQLGQKRLANVELFFTDEPFLAASERWVAGRANVAASVQWTDSFATEFSKRKGYDIKQALMYVFADCGAKTAKFRMDFYDVYTDLVAENYYGQIGDWCRKNNTKFSGHMLLEESLLYHITFSGSYFKNYMNMDIPGIDYLGCNPYLSMPRGWASAVFENHDEDFTLKLPSSVANIYGKVGAFSEVFACAVKTDNLKRAKSVLAMHSAEGITHICTYGLENFLMPEEFKKLADFSARLTYFAREGKSVSKVAVLVPESTIWAVFNPPTNGGFAGYFKNNAQAKRVDVIFRQTVLKLLRSQIQFELVSPAMLKDAQCTNAELHIGQMAFSHLIVPAEKFTTSIEDDVITKFVHNGGKVCYVGDIPQSQKLSALLKSHSKFVSFQKDLVLQEVQLPKQTFEFVGSDKIRVQVRKCNGKQFAIIANPSESETVFSLKINDFKSYQIFDANTGLVDARKVNSEPLKIVMPASSAIVILGE